MNVDPQIRQVIVGRVITELRKQARLSQEEFAARVGVSQPTLSRFERGTHSPDLVQFSAMAAVLGRSEVELQQVIDQALHRTREAAAGATRTTPGQGTVWATALKVAGIVGIAGLAAFAVAAVLAELDEDEDA